MYYGDKKILSVVKVEEDTRFNALVDRSISGVLRLEGLSKIGKYAFANCGNLESVEIPSTVTDIGERAFYGCGNIHSLTIPSSVTNIGAYALVIGVATITMKRHIPPTIATSTFIPQYLIKIIVPKGCGDVYKSSTNWAYVADYIEEEAE